MAAEGDRSEQKFTPPQLCGQKAEVTSCHFQVSCQPLGLHSMLNVNETIIAIAC